MWKEYGGMGFRHFYGFNLAMLGKQGWKIATDNDAIVTRVFKTKYFPNEDFMGAWLGHNPSLVCRNIHTSRVVVKLGMRWRIDNGQKINIWHHPWLRAEDNLYATSVPVTGTENWKVVNLVDTTTHFWNQTLVSSLFNPTDVRAILCTPPPCFQIEDRPIWSLSRNGFYSVESAYFGAIEKLLDNSHLKIDGSWMDIWNLKIPPKVKLLMWHVVRGVLPTRSKLVSKGVQCPGICPFCEVGDENEHHAFFDCSHALTVWEAAGFRQVVEGLIPQASDFHDLMFRMLNSVQQEQMLKIAMIIWCLWRRRNDKVWLNEEKNVNVCIELAMQSLFDWDVAKARHINNAHHTNNVAPSRWEKPLEGCLKCDVDAAIFHEVNSHGVGICVRNHLGELLHAKTILITGSPPAEEAEARGLWEAISWISHLGLHNVSFELDCKSVVDATVEGTNHQTEAAIIISKCRERLLDFSSYSISFIRRQANVVAHALARASRFYASYHVFYSIPTCIVDAILNEMK